MAEEKSIVDINGVARRYRHTYTTDFKKQIVALYETGGYSYEQICKEYDLPHTTFSRWMHKYRTTGSFKEKDNRSKIENELIELKKELIKLKMENDILKKAALIFGKKEDQP